MEDCIEHRHFPGVMGLSDTELVETDNFSGKDLD